MEYFVIEQADHTDRSQRVHTGLSQIHFVLRYLPSFIVSLLLTLLIKKEYSYKTTDLLSFAPQYSLEYGKNVILIKRFVKCVPPTSSLSRILFMATHFLTHLSEMKNLET